MNKEAVDQALSGVRSGLEADGFTLFAQEVKDDGRVVVVLEPGGADCLDCLVPDDMLQQIVSRAVKAALPEATDVLLVKVGFDALESH